MLDFFVLVTDVSLKTHNKIISLKGNLMLLTFIVVITIASGCHVDVVFAGSDANGEVSRLQWHGTKLNFLMQYGDFLYCGFVLCYFNLYSVLVPS